MVVLTISLVSLGCCLCLAGRGSSVRLYQREGTWWLAPLCGPQGFSQLGARGDDLLATGHAALRPSVSPTLGDPRGEGGREETSLLRHHLAQVSSDTVRRDSEERHCSVQGN